MERTTRIRKLNWPLAIALAIVWTVIATPGFAQRQGREGRGTVPGNAAPHDSSRSFNLGSSGGPGVSRGGPAMDAPRLQSSSPNLSRVPSAEGTSRSAGRFGSLAGGPSLGRNSSPPSLGGGTPTITGSSPSRVLDMSKSASRSPSNTRITPPSADASRLSARSSRTPTGSSSIRTSPPPSSQPPTINRNDVSARVKSLLEARGTTPPSNSITGPSSRTLPPLGHDGPSDRKARSPLREMPRPDADPSVGIFRPRTDSLAGHKPPIGPAHDRDGHAKGGPGDSLRNRDGRGDGHPGGPGYREPFHAGIDHRGPPHGTPRHDYRMHGTLDRHSLYPGYYSYGRYGYRGSSFSIYLGSPLYSYPSYTYYEPYYYSVPYYVPYSVPVPYVVEEVVEGAAVEPSPAVTAPMVENGAVIPAAEGAVEFQLQAERAFREHRYEDAARLSNHAIVEDNQNGKLHLFASQTFFALEDYASAAAAVQQAASLLDRSQWGFVVENYQEFYRGEDYVTQMARLDEYIAKNPDAAHAYFLRGYHFLFLGHKEAARNDLAKAVALESRDLLAAELLKMADGTVPEPAGVPPQAEIIPPPPGEQAKPGTDS